MSTSFPLPRSRNPCMSIISFRCLFSFNIAMTGRTPSPVQIRASDSNTKAQYEAERKRLAHSKKALNEENTQKYHHKLISQCFTPSPTPSLSTTKTSPASSSQSFSTPVKATGSQLATPSSTLGRSFGSLGLDSKVDLWDDEGRELGEPPSPNCGRGLTMKRSPLQSIKRIPKTSKHQIGRVYRSDRGASLLRTMTDHVSDDKSAEIHSSFTVHSSSILMQDTASTVLQKNETDMS